MEPKFQTSFIPKSPIVSTKGSEVKMVHTTNIFSIIATFVFLAVLIVSAGLFAYKNILKKQISEAKTSLVDVRAVFEPEKIQELVDINTRISVTKNLLEKHIILSEFLLFLQKTIVQKVRFDKLSYTNNGKDMTISIDTEAESYNAIAQQVDILSKNQFINEPFFSNFDLGENGTIRMKFFAKIVPDLISYKKKIQLEDQ